MLALVFAPVASVLPPWVVILALGLCAASWFCLFAEPDLWSRVSLKTKRITMAACLALFLATASTHAVSFVPWWPCTEENWTWMEQNLGYWGAIWMWYGVYGCS